MNHQTSNNESHELKQLVAHESAVIGELPQPQLVQRPSFRSRNRPTISWGPPPIAPYNVTQLPYKIDETPSSSPSSTTAPLPTDDQTSSHEL